MPLAIKLALVAYAMSAKSGVQPGNGLLVAACVTRAWACGPPHGRPSQPAARNDAMG